MVGRISSDYRRQSILVEWLSVCLIYLQIRNAIVVHNAFIALWRISLEGASSYCENLITYCIKKKLKKKFWKEWKYVSCRVISRYSSYEEKFVEWQRNCHCFHREYTLFTCPLYYFDWRGYLYNGAQAVAFSRCRITVGYFTNCFL